ncbi:MAG: hypothetical protein B6U94_03725 [Thermofilum sp. ex4484_79]|nr:MAG: hypothetical protein B6U94_03725 [Thermofilum sp. ex4484_79]
MYSVRAALFVLLCIGIFLLAILTGYYPLLVLSLPLILLISFSFIISPSIELDNLEVKRKIDTTRLIVGEEIKVEVLLKNNSEKTYFLEISDNIPPFVQVKNGTLRTFVMLNPGEEFKLGYTLRFPTRGHFDLGPLEVVLFDYLKIRFNKYSVGKPVTISVFPTFEDLKDFDIRPKRTGVWPGTITSKRSGQGTEFYGIREYIPGDEIRRINWKAYARLQRLVTNEFESERVTDVLIIVDTSGGEMLGAYASKMLEAEVNAAASLSWLFLKHGNRVGLIVHGRHRGWIKPYFGKKQFLRILHFLADVSLGGIISLDYLLKNLLPMILKPETQIILITPLLDRNILSVIHYALLNNYKILVLTPSIYYSMMDSQDKKEFLMGRILRLMKENIMLKVGKLCPIIEWNVNMSLNDVLKYSKRDIRLYSR